MKKKLVTFFIILNLTILSISLASAEPNNSKSPEQFVKEFLCAKMKTIVSKNINDIDKFYSKKSRDSQKYMMFTKQNLLQEYLIAYASHDYVIEKVTPQVKIISSNVENDTATVEAILKTAIYWNASNALGKPIVGMKSEKHIFKLSKENNKWKIIMDQYMTSRGHSDESLKEDYTRLSHTIEKLEKEAKESISRSKQSEPAKLTLAFSESHNKNRIKSIFAPGKNEANQSLPKVTASYNRDSANNWAYTYWDTYSTACINLGDQKWEGGDCTNFISQCLKAGGASNDKIGSYQWYYDNNGSSKTAAASYSWTWATARGFNYTILGNYKTNEYGPKGTEKVITSDSDYTKEMGQSLTYGDFVQYEWSPTSKIEHSAIIVNMIYNSSKDRYEPVIAEHSHDAWYIPWTNNAYKTHFIHITGIN
ncbi:MAG TPA: amidase domain-containing protein [Ruminiclostridium sp.]